MHPELELFWDLSINPDLTWALLWKQISSRVVCSYVHIGHLFFLINLSMSEESIQKM
jgi:hypothetical protein